MAKSVRASVQKRNKAKLRATVFGPVVDARTERLSAKLQELASQPKPNDQDKSKSNAEAIEIGTYRFSAASGLVYLLLTASRYARQQPNNKHRKQ
jgi:hypothetical protein